MVVAEEIQVLKETIQHCVNEYGEYVNALYHDQLNCLLQDIERTIDSRVVLVKIEIISLSKDVIDEVIDKVESQMSQNIEMAEFAHKVIVGSSSTI